jgi:hypothetical protein
MFRDAEAISIRNSTEKKRHGEFSLVVFARGVSRLIGARQTACRQALSPHSGPHHNRSNKKSISIFCRSKNVKTLVLGESYSGSNEENNIIAVLNELYAVTILTLYMYRDL